MGANETLSRRTLSYQRTCGEERFSYEQTSLLWCAQPFGIVSLHQGSRDVYALAVAHQVHSGALGKCVSIPKPKGESTGGAGLPMEKVRWARLSATAELAGLEPRILLQFYGCFQKNRSVTKIPLIILPEDQMPFCSDVLAPGCAKDPAELSDEELSRAWITYQLAEDALYLRSFGVNSIASLF